MSSPFKSEAAGAKQLARDTLKLAEEVGSRWRKRVSSAREETFDKQSALRGSNRMRPKGRGKSSWESHAGVGITILHGSVAGGIKQARQSWDTEIKKYKNASFGQARQQKYIGGGFVGFDSLID